MTILTDDVLLYVFDFYLEASKVEAWHTLVHVCRRWRTIVFGSPRRLNLQIACTNKSRVRELLDVWPALPIVVLDNFKISHDNIKAVLEHHDRVCQIKLNVSNLAEVFTALGASYPVLTDLELLLFEVRPPGPFLPDPVKFLGGSSNLQSLSFIGIPVPGIPELLLSCTNLVNLHLKYIKYVPTPDLFSPDAIVTVLSTLTRLETLHLDLESDSSSPDWENRPLPLPTPTVLHSLIKLRFNGLIEYLDDFMARIDAPSLYHLDIAIRTDYYQVIVFNTSQIPRFISHIPEFQALDEAHIGIDCYEFAAWIKFVSTRTASVVLKLDVISDNLGRQFSCLAQFCRSPAFPLPTLEYLCFSGGEHMQCWHLDIENIQWPELLQPFTSVKYLYLSKHFAQCIATALEQLGGEIPTEVFPALENVLIEKSQLCGPVSEAFQNFTAMRQLSGHPIVVSDWDPVRSGPVRPGFLNQRVDRLQPVKNINR